MLKLASEKLLFKFYSVEFFLKKGGGIQNDKLHLLCSVKLSKYHGTDLQSC